MRGKGLFLLAVPLLACGTPVRHHQIYCQGEPVPHLFAYTGGELRKPLGQVGLGESFVGHVGRSGNGDQLLIFPLLASDNRVVELWPGGRAAIREEATPFRVCCNQAEFLSWYRSGRDITTPEGARRSPLPFGRISTDPTGYYFFVNIGDNETAVASTQDPSKALYIGLFSGQAIFSRAGAVYLFGQDRSWYRAHGTTRELICHVLSPGHGGLSLVRAVRIPRPGEPVEVGSPFYVADMSPFSEMVILVDARDLPLWDRWVLFDIGTGRSAVLGRARGHALFLADDILAAVARRSPATTAQSPAASNASR